MQNFGLLILVAVAVALVVMAVVLYSLVARKMYAKDKEVVKRHRESATPKEAEGSPK